MDRETFRTQLREAAQTAAEFARGFVVEPLPDAYAFVVYFKRGSAPSEMDVRTDAAVVADDELAELEHASLDEATDTLWRVDRSPEWIDVSVHDVVGDHTVIELRASRCLLLGSTRVHAGFHVLGPTLPHGYEDGDRFSLHETRRHSW